MVRNLQYGPRTRLVRGINVQRSARITSLNIVSKPHFKHVFISKLRAHTVAKHQLVDSVFSNISVSNKADLPRPTDLVHWLGHDAVFATTCISDTAPSSTSTSTTK